MGCGTSRHRLDVQNCCPCVLKREAVLPYHILSSRLISLSSPIINVSSLEKLVFFFKSGEYDTFVSPDSKGSASDFSRLLLLLEYVSHNITLYVPSNTSLSPRSIKHIHSKSDPNIDFEKPLDQGPSSLEEVFATKTGSPLGIVLLLQLLVQSVFPTSCCDIIMAFPRCTNICINNKVKSDISSLSNTYLCRMLFQDEVFYIDIISALNKNIYGSVFNSIPAPTSTANWLQYIIPEDLFDSLYVKSSITSNQLSHEFNGCVMFPGSCVLRVELSEGYNESELLTDDFGQVDFKFTCHREDVSFNFTCLSRESFGNDAKSDVSLFPKGDLDFSCFKRFLHVPSDSIIRQKYKSKDHYHVNVRATLRFAKPGQYWVLFEGNTLHNQTYVVSLLRVLVVKTPKVFIPFPHNLNSEFNSLIDVVSPSSYVLAAKRSIPFHIRIPAFVVGLQLRLDDFSPVTVFPRWLWEKLKSN
ncbi:hypothetical protein GEMRC1_001704 [Eukaryota sp. GEM-RC1]